MTGSCGGGFLAAALAVAGALGLSGCEKDKLQAPQPAKQSPLPGDGTAVRKVTATVDRIAVQMDLAAVRSAVRAWHAERGTYPARIDDLKIEGLRFPADMVYDSRSGNVKSAAYPEL